MIVRNDNIQEAQIDQLPDYQLLYDDAFGLTKVNLKAWFKSDTGVTLSGGKVTNWESQWGTPAISAANTGVDWEANGTLNGYTGIKQPNTANQSLDFSSAIDISASYTIFAVLLCPEEFAEYIFKSSVGGMCGINLKSDYGGPGLFLFDGSSLVAGGSNLYTAQIAMWQSGPNGTNLRQNGTQVLTGAAAKAVSPSGFFGRSGITVWEALIYGDVKSNTDIINIENYLKSKYGF
jgi:hypothetical protein